MSDYQQKVIREGDLASADLGTLVRDTKKFSSQEIREISYGPSSVHLLFPKSEYDLVTIPVAGEPRITDPYDAAFMFVKSASFRARNLGFHPVAFTNALDLSEIDNQKIIPAAKAGLYDAAQRFSLWAANGETAGLGDRVTVPYNITGAVIALARKWEYANGVHQSRGFHFSVSPHHNKGVYTNTDGDGTKPEWNERLFDIGEPFAEWMVQDGTAMLWDDAIKINADIIQDVRILELQKYNDKIEKQVQAAIQELSKRTGVHVALLREVIGTRISGYGRNPMNLTGTTVSLCDEETIKKLPHPEEGDYIIGLYNQNRRNLRCNGITDQRKALVQKYGWEWHKTHEMQLRWIAAPSTVFYPFFKEMFNEGLATQVGHFSGGAYEGKFARVLGRFGLGADLEVDGHSFQIQELLKNMQGQSLEAICKKQPYRFEAWMTTKDPEKTKAFAQKHNLAAISLGQAKKMEEPLLTVKFLDLGETATFKGR